MAKKRTIISGPIPNIDANWDDGTNAYDGGAIEDFIKSQLKSKGGDFFVDDSVDSYLTFYTFRSTEDKTAWLLDRNETSLVLHQQTFSVASRNGEGTAYVVKLTSMGVPEPKFTNVKKLIVPLKFICKKATTVGGSTTTEDMAGTSGSIVVSGRKAGVSGSFQTITPIDGDTRYIDAVPESSENFVNFDLGPYLQDGEWNYRINVVEPEKLTSSTAVAVNVTMSESMGLSYAGNLGHVFEGESVSLPFYVKGSVSRHLHIQILSADGNDILATPEPIAFTANEGGGETVQNISITSSQYTFKHGTYRIRAWLTFASDIHGTKVNEQTFGIMYKEQGNNTVLVAISDAISTADNYDTATLLRYAVYNPENAPYELLLSIIDGTNGDRVYYSKASSCENGNVYEMHTALNCEHELGDFSVLVKISHGGLLHYGGTVLLRNSMDFSPRGTADLLLNASTREFYGSDTRGNHFEFDTAKLMLKDQAKDNLTKLINPTIEGFVRENGIDRLRLVKGSLLDLPFEPIVATTGLNMSGVDYSLTMEFDIAISKIVDESAPVISCFSETSTGFVGLKVLPNRILVMGNGQGPISTPDMADYYLEEGRRIHLAVNIVNNLRNEGLNYMRIFADGVIQREYTYPSGQFSPFCDPSGTNGYLKIGSTGCNIDLFGVRVMINEPMSSAYIQQNYKASMSSIDEKRSFVAANDAIMNGDMIDYNKAKGVYNTILYELPSNKEFITFNNDSGKDKVNNVRMTVLIVGDDKHSGVFSSVEMKRQGSTAKKYYWPNISTKLCKSNPEKGIVKGTFTSIGIDQETGKPYYDKTNYYQLDDKQPKSKKWVGKSNYASSMQSHKLGATAAYNDLHRLCAMPKGGFSYDQNNPLTPSRRSVLEKPFLCFYTDKKHSTPTFCGFQTWGAAKGDKATFGYDDDPESESYTPNYVMVEGADNNVPGANFETPWIPSEMNYDASEESFCYNGAPNFDFDLGAMNEDESHPSDGAMSTLNNYIIPGFNMVYLCNPNMKPFSGSLSALNQAYLRDKAKFAANITEGLELESNVHYWNCDVTSSEYMNVYRMDYITDKWVDAGLTTSSIKDNRGFNAINITKLNLKVQLGLTDNDLFGMTNEEKTKEIVKRRVELFKKQFPSMYDVSDMLFNRCMNLMWGGTDNNTKNTYYWVEGNIDHKIRMDGDDLDTIFKTDNKGQQSKPYWIMFDDKDAYGAWFWNGRDNALCRLIDLAYPDDLRVMMNKIFSAMVTLCGSVENFFQEYFFYVQEYYPAVAYNETARLLYETAQLYYEGIHPSNPGKTYGYKEMPITQSLGNQIHAEREYMTKRLALIESYANFGDFSLNGKDSVTFTSTGSSTYNIKWTAFQDIFPVASFGQALDYGTDSNGVHHDRPWRLKAGETCSFVASMSGETTVAIHGMSFCAEVSNLGANAIKGNLRMTGKRLRKLVMPRISQLFSPSSIVMSSDMNLEEIDWRNIDFSNSSPAFDFTNMSSLNKLDLSGCQGIVGVEVPKTAALKALLLPSGLSRLELRDMPSLNTFSIDDVSDLKHVFIDAQKIDTLALAGEIKEFAKGVLTVSMHNVNWKGLPVSTLMWFADIPPYSYGTASEIYALTGRATVDQSQSRIKFHDKRKLVTVFGDIDAPIGSALFLSYDKYAINRVFIGGNAYIKDVGVEEYVVNAFPATSNNIAIITEPDGTVHEDIKFSFVGESGEEMFPNQFCSWNDAVKGILNVTKTTTEGGGRRYTMRVKVGTIVDGGVKYLFGEMRVGFYLRHPKLGDFAYADGTFDSQCHKDKTIVGMVYKINPKYQGINGAPPTIYDGFNMPSDNVKRTQKLIGYQILVACKEHAFIRSSDGFISTDGNAWGILPSGQNEEVQNGWGFGKNICDEIAASIGADSVTDTPVKNSASITPEINESGEYLFKSVCVDNEQEDGFKKYSKSNAAINDWEGKRNTASIVRHMKSIFNNYLMGNENDKIETSWVVSRTPQLTITKKLEKLPENNEDLGNMMEILQKANGDVDIFRLLAYPAAYSCYLYEPVVQDGEHLNPQYKKKNWYLPSAGELARQYIYFAASRTGGWGDSWQFGQNTSPSSHVIENMILDAYRSSSDNIIKSNVSYEHIQSGNYDASEIDAIEQYFNSMIDIEKPLYSLLLWRISQVGVSGFSVPSNQAYWSSTEYNGGSSFFVHFQYGWIGSHNKYHKSLVRPFVAFEFSL